MASIAASDLKTKGVSALDPIITEHRTAMITVRGKNRYVVMDIETYQHLRECELEAALAETRKDIAQGDIVTDSVTDHIRRIRDEL